MHEPALQRFSDSPNLELDFKKHGRRDFDARLSVRHNLPIEISLDGCQNILTIMKYSKMYLASRLTQAT